MFAQSKTAIAANAEVKGQTAAPCRSCGRDAQWTFHAGPPCVLLFAGVLPEITTPVYRYGCI